MKKYDFKMVILAICVSYTIISLLGGLINFLLNPESGAYFANSIMMFVWCSIAVGVIFTHNWFEKISPLVVIVFQYLVAQGLVFFTLFCISFFSEVHPNSYRDGFRSFVIPYAIGAAVYYISNYLDAKRTNKKLQQLKAQKQIK